jgi:hypothetical protein
MIKKTQHKVVLVFIVLGLMHSIYRSLEAAYISRDPLILLFDLLELWPVILFIVFVYFVLKVALTSNINMLIRQAKQDPDNFIKNHIIESEVNGNEVLRVMKGCKKVLKVKVLGLIEKGALVLFETIDHDKQWYRMKFKAARASVMSKDNQKNVKAELTKIIYFERHFPSL